VDASSLLEFVSQLIFSKLFWVTLMQWFLLAPASIAVSRWLVVRRDLGLLTALLETAVMLTTMALILIVPLYVLGLFPLRFVGDQKAQYLIAVAIGGIASIPLKQRIQLAYWPR
jgi:hypothetical protein